MSEEKFRIPVEQPTGDVQHKYERKRTKYSMALFKIAVLSHCPLCTYTFQERHRHLW